MRKADYPEDMTAANEFLKRKMELELAECRRSLRRAGWRTKSQG